MNFSKALRTGIYNTLHALHWPHVRPGMALCTYAAVHYAKSIDKVNCTACVARIHADASRRLGAP